MSTLDETVAALRAGRPVLLPTDTVYGLCALEGERAARRLSELKGRDAAQPIALLFADLETAVARVPEAERARRLLPGPYTIVLPGPGSGSIGIRVPLLPPEAAAVVRAVGAVLATSANRHGGPNPRRLDDVPEELRAACAAEIDAGELPGVPSTVVDLTGTELRVVREGAVAAAEIFSRLRA